MFDKVKVVIVMTAAVLLAACGEALAAKGMKEAGQQNGLMAEISAALHDWHVISAGHGVFQVLPP